MISARSACVRSVIPILSCIALGGCDTGQKPAPASQTGIELFVDPAKSLYVEPNMPLGELLGRYTERMGWKLLASDPVRAKLAELHCNYTERIEVPFGSVHGFVETLVFENRLLLRFEHKAVPVVLQVIDPEDKERGDIPEHRVLVPAAELPRWEAHPAHMITTQVPLPAGDADVLVRSLRAILGEAGRGQVIQTGDTKSMLFSGTGTEVARLARILGEAAQGPSNADAQPPVQLERTKWIELLHAPSKGLHLEPSERGELTLQGLVDAYVNLMGWRLLAGRDTRNQLRVLKCGVALPLDIPAENVHGFVESVLRTNDFVLRFAYAQEPILLGIDTTNVAGRGSPRQDAMFVPPAELPRWASHPDFLVTTCLELPGVDVRTLSNSMRQMFSDQQTQQIIPVGNTNGLIVTGFGSDVADLAAMLRTLVDAAAGVHMAPPVPLGGGPGAELFVTPAKGLHLERPEKRELKLFDLFDQYAQLMGWHLLTDLSTRSELVSVKYPYWLPLDIPPRDVHSFVEAVARANNVVFSFAHTREPVMLHVASINMVGNGNARADAISVSPDELPRWADHPAFLVTTLVDLPGLDVRVLSNSLRQQYSDQQTQQIIPLGNADGLIITGFADQVPKLVASLFEENRKAMAERPPVARAVPDRDRSRLFPQGGSAFELRGASGGEGEALAALEVFGRWTQRPLEISEAARSILVNAVLSPERPSVLVAELVYPCIGLMLDRVGCTLSPSPGTAPTKWVIDVAAEASETVKEEWPSIALEDLTAWGAYCATPFRTELPLPTTTDSELVDRMLRVVRPSGSRGSYDWTRNRVVLLWGTPREIQLAAGMIRQACEPVTTKPR